MTLLINCPVWTDLSLQRVRVQRVKDKRQHFCLDLLARRLGQNNVQLIQQVNSRLQSEKQTIEWDDVNRLLQSEKQTIDEMT